MMPYTTIATLHNVAYRVPKLGAPWRVGVLNVATGEVVHLGDLLDALMYDPRPEEVVFFITGLPVKNGSGSIILNRSFAGLCLEDFGRSRNFTVEVKTRTLSDGREFTFLSLTPSDGASEWEIKIDPPLILEEDQYITIIGTDAKVVFRPIE